MSNGKEIINEIDYQQRIKSMKSRELSEFTAMQVYETKITVQNLGHRVSTLERPSKKRQITFGGSIITFIIAIIYALGAKCGWWSP